MEIKKILIIEDELSIAELERDYLEISGYDVDIETDGEIGLKRAIEKDYSLIILDLMLPGIDGYTICKKIREEKEIPIIMVTAKGDEIDKVRGLGLGADDYMTKPFSPQEMVARVKSHIDRYERIMIRAGEKKQDIESIKVDGLKLEADTMRVLLYDEEITMTKKEFDLLYLLMSNPNIVFSKEKLFENIWGMDSIGDISTVAVHIRKIREKIEKDPSKPKYIETVWGAGYRLKKR